MTKICNIKSEIKDLGITIDKAIIIQVLNFFDTSFMLFFGILSHKIREKEKLLLVESHTKFLENQKLEIKNQDKILVNYAKQFTKKR